MELCCNCKKVVIKDDVALCKKLLGKKTKQFMCRKCLSEFLGTEEEALTEKIQQFKEEGCTLFV